MLGAFFAMDLETTAGASHTPSSHPLLLVYAASFVNFRGDCNVESKQRRRRFDTSPAFAPTSSLAILNGLMMELMERMT